MFTIADLSSVCAEHEARRGTAIQGFVRTCQFNSNIIYIYLNNQREHFGCSTIVSGSDDTTNLGSWRNIRQSKGGGHK